MAYDIKWTIPGKESYDDIITYLEKEWTEREIKKFVTTANKKLKLIISNPLLFPATSKRKHIHKTVINKQVVLFYRHLKPKQHIEILLFWNTKRNPSKLKL